MKIAKVDAVAGINNGEPFSLHCPLTESEFKQQLQEIFIAQHYKKGLRKKNMVVVDLGACIGLSALYFKDWAKKIYAVEPSKEAYEALVENTKDYPNIECFNVAIGHENTEWSIFSTTPDGATQTLFPHPAAKVYKEEKVEMVTLEKFFKDNNIEHCDVLKIDTEGCEYTILAEPNFGNVSDKIDFIIGEAHFVLSQPEMIPEILKDYGFKTKFIKGVNNAFLTLKVLTNNKIYKKYYDTIFYAEHA